MSYCVLADIQDFLSKEFTATTTPTADNISALCTAAQDEIIDPMIEGYVSLPISDSKALNYLKGASRYWVAAQVCFIDPELLQLGERYLGEFEKMMSSAMEKPSILSAATLRPAPIGSSRPAAPFERGNKNW